MPIRSLRPVFNAGLSACLLLSVSMTAATPARASDARPPEIAFVGEVITEAQTELDHLILVFDEMIDPTSIPGPEEETFTVYVNDVPEAPASVELSYQGFAGPNGFFGSAGASFVRLGLATPLEIAAIETLEVGYTPGETPIRDLALNEMVVPPTPVTAELAVADPIFFLGATVDYSHGTDRVLLVFSEPLDLGSIPAADRFILQVNETPTSVTVETPMTNIGIGLIDLVLPMHLSGSETLLVSYVPGDQPLTGRYSDQEAGGFTNAPVDYFLPLNGTTEMVAPDGQATTFYGDGPTDSDPLATTIEVPPGGPVTITEQPLTDATNPGYTFFGQQVLITAPDAVDAAHPLLITFDLHASLIPAGEDAQSIAILRNDVPVPVCAAIAPSSAVASPPTCVWQRIDQPDGGVKITVATLQASRWNFGRAEPIDFNGFGPPVGGAPIRNGMKSGGAVPLKFSLGGNRGTAIFVAGSPSSQAVTCDTEDPFDEVELTVAVGGSSLNYNAASDSYTYVWKTQKAWTGCRKLTLTFSDGSVEEVIFQFRP